MFEFTRDVNGSEICEPNRTETEPMKKPKFKVKKKLCSKAKFSQRFIFFGSVQLILQYLYGKTSVQLSVFGSVVFGFWLSYCI